MKWIKVEVVEKTDQYYEVADDFVITNWAIQDLVDECDMSYGLGDIICIGQAEQVCEDDLHEFWKRSAIYEEKVHG